MQGNSHVDNIINSLYSVYSISEKDNILTNAFTTSAQIIVTTNSMYTILGLNWKIVVFNTLRLEQGHFHQ